MKPRTQTQWGRQTRLGVSQKPTRRQRSKMGLLPTLTLLVWLCPVSRATHRGPPEIVLAPVSSLAVLPCALRTLRPSALAYRAFSLSWSFDSTSLAKGPVSVLRVGSDGVVRRGRDGPGLRAAPRGISSGNLSLQLQDIRPQDAGTFHCSARLGAERVEREVRLYVVEAARCSSGPVLEGDRVDFTCNITDGSPPPTFSWERHGEVVMDSERITLRDGGRGISVRDVGEKDVGEWVCRVRCGGSEAKAAYTLKVYGFSRRKSETRTLFSDLGSTASLSLPLLPGTSSLPVEWDWARSSEARSPTNLTERGGAGRFRSRLGEESGLELTVEHLQEADRGVYTGHLRLRGWHVERSLRLEVAWVSPSRVGPMLLGEPLRLEVKSTFPDGIELYRWSGPNTSQVTYQETMGNVTIASLGLWDAGRWKCELLHDGELVGSVLYLLDVHTLERQEGDKRKSTAWGTLFAILGSLVILVVTIAFIIRSWIKSHRQNFPALEITLPTVESSGKKL